MYSKLFLQDSTGRDKVSGQKKKLCRCAYNWTREEKTKMG